MIPIGLTNLTEGGLPLSASGRLGKGEGNGGIGFLGRIDAFHNSRVLIRAWAWEALDALARKRRIKSSWWAISLCWLR